MVERSALLVLGFFVEAKKKAAPAAACFFVRKTYERKTDTRTLQEHVRTSVAPRGRSAGVDLVSVVFAGRSSRLQPMLSTGNS